MDLMTDGAVCAGTVMAGFRCDIGNRGQHNKCQHYGQQACHKNEISLSWSALLCDFIIFYTFSLPFCQGITSSRARAGALRRSPRHGTPRQSGAPFPARAAGRFPSRSHRAAPARAKKHDLPQRREDARRGAGAKLRRPPPLSRRKNSACSVRRRVSQRRSASPKAF